MNREQTAQAVAHIEALRDAGMASERQLALLPIMKAFALGRTVEWGYAHNPQTIWTVYNPLDKTVNLDGRINFMNPELQWRWRRCRSEQA